MSAKFNDEITVQESLKDNESGLSLVVERILGGIDAGFDFYGKNVGEIFYAEMESSQGLRRSEILDNPGTFEESLGLFFRSGAPIVDRAIGRGILREFDLPLSAGLTFKKAVEIVSSLYNK